jgi:membrane-associated phospholipid phosphatase
MRSQPVSPVQFVAAAATIALLFVALYFIFVRTHDGQLVDQLAYDGSDFGRRSIAPFTQGLLDALPAVAGVIGVALTIVIALVRRNFGSFLVALASAGAAAASTQVLKYAVLGRPYLGVEGFAENSFPSGHTTVAAASALAVLLVSSPRVRPAVAGWGAAFTVLAGVSTLVNQWHRPSDVIAALLVVAFWGCVGGIVLSVLARRTTRGTRGNRGTRGTRGTVGIQPGRPRGGTSNTRLWRWLILPFVLVTAVSFMITWVAVAGSHDAPYTVAYVGGAAAITAVGLIVALVASRGFARLP